MTIAFLKKTPIERFRLLETRLNGLGENINTYKVKSADQLSREIYDLNEDIAKMQDTLPFASGVRNPRYVKTLLLKDALSALKEHKISRDESVELIEGMTYYSAKVEKGRVIGKRATLKEGKAGWYAINESVPVMKAIEVLRYGSDEAFRKVYFEMANGLGLKALDKFDFQHIRQSTPQALKLIENYCDQNWEGKWPWEFNAPKKIRDLIKENTQMSIKKFRTQFDFRFEQLMEGEMEKSQIVTELGAMMDKVDSMIETLGRTAGTLMTTTRDSIRTEYGDDAMADLESSLSDKIRATVDSLGELKSAISSKVDSLSGGTPEAGPAEFDAPIGDVDMGDGDEDEKVEVEFDDEAVVDDEEFDFDLENMDGEREKQ